MKRFFTLVIICCSILSAKAQFGVGGGGPTTVGRISGTIIDSVTKQPVDYATVGLYRATGKSPITGVVTDPKGNFKLDNVHPGTYRIEIAFVGYATKVVGNVTTTLTKPDKNVGIIKMSSSTKTLNEVQVAGTRPLIENHIDKIVYNAEQDLTSAGGNATDVLQKVPLVAVDINGNVSLRGDANVRVLINGKPSGATSANLSDVLKTIPADQIKSIEVITSPSAKYDAEGTAGILNIITKQKSVSGVSGSVSGGVGTRQNNGNFNLNYNKNRFSLTANVGGNLTWPQQSLTSFAQTFTSGTTTSSQGYNGSSDIKRHGILGSVNLSYDINSFNNISSNIRLNQGAFSTLGSLINYNTSLTPSIYNSSTNSNNTFGGFDWSADYTHKYQKEGHELSFSGQWSHSVVNTNYTSIYAAVNPNQQSINDGTNNEYTIQSDYVNPITKNFKLEAGAKAIFRVINSNVDANVANAANPNSFINDPVNSYLYDYDQDVYAAYTVLTFNLPHGITLMPGVRVENTAIKGDPINSLQVGLLPFTQNYTTFVPSFTIQKALTPTQTIKLSYSKRISRPSLTYLNPFLNKSNILSESEGNPSLSPEIAQTVEFNYNTFIGASIINASVYYKHTQGLIESIATPDSITTSNNTKELATLTKYVNIGNSNSIGASVFGSVNPIKILTLRANINAYTYNPNPSGSLVSDQTENGTYIQYNAFGSGSVTLNSGFIAEVFAIENSPRRTIQGTNPSFSLFGVGVRKQFLNKKASLGINALQPFSKYKDFNQNISSPGFTQTSMTQFPFRSFGLTFSYSFGKLNFTAPKDKNAINNDDLKQGDQGGMGGGTTPPAGGGTQSSPPRQ